MDDDEGLTLVKSVPDDTIYLTTNGTRVRIVRVKQFPIRADDPLWRQEITRNANERMEVVRVSDGHALWGCEIESLKPEAA